jgi:hypothetical protein
MKLQRDRPWSSLNVWVLPDLSALDAPTLGVLNVGVLEPPPCKAVRIDARLLEAATPRRQERWTPPLEAAQPLEPHANQTGWSDAIASLLRNDLLERTTGFEPATLTLAR